ncbi:Putative SKP1/BTB/POZ domain superfamily protein [Colletotrichum destructivum]|uniref:SKP1/BTB/POZ domain superfamily protein n=1 Tax=Colletotrichum destructivum TaxID=34406 RepID=A0AAX4I642_9PEZI|nr:Putative SKP1/BTB/POZ domain superfamily protein [Colletotrichum destructivum]
MRGVDLRHLWTTGEYSDLTINASGVIFKVHRCVVFPQCEAWKNIPEENGQLVLQGPKITQAILQFMYSGTYTPAKMRCQLAKPVHTSDDISKTGDSSGAAHGLHHAHDSSALSYDDHSMLLSACVMSMAKKYKMKDLENQAENALVAVAPSLTGHAEFIKTIEQVLKTYQDQQGLDIVLKIIRPEFSKSPGLRRRLQAVMKIYPHLALELLEQLASDLHRMEKARLVIAQGQQKTMSMRDGALSPKVADHPCTSIPQKGVSALPHLPWNATMPNNTAKGDRLANAHQSVAATGPPVIPTTPNVTPSLTTSLPRSGTAVLKRKNEDGLLNSEKRPRSYAN